jgi:SBP domain
VEIDGKQHRFCQQCCRFHDIAAFDGVNRSALGLSNMQIVVIILDPVCAIVSSLTVAQLSVCASCYLRLKSDKPWGSLVSMRPAENS